MNKVREALKKISEQKRNKEGSHSRVKGLVSVCIPNFNKGEYIRDAIMSISRQTYSPIELIIVDDASTDNSRRVLEPMLPTLKKQFYHVDFIKLPRNLGCAWAQNIAYYASKGQYIANMDSDDVSLPHRIEMQVDAVMDKGYDLVGCNFNIFQKDQYNPEIPDGGHWLKYDPEEIEDSYLIHSVHCICFGTCLFKSEVLERTGGLNKEFIGTEDWEFIDRVASKGFKLGNIPDILYSYRSHSEQRSKLFHNSSV